MKIKPALKQLAAAAVFAVAAVAGTAANAQGLGPKIGILICYMVPGNSINLLFYSSQSVMCELWDGRGLAERYRGSTGIGFGLDLEARTNERITFTVFATNFRRGAYQLAGRYRGVKASATLGLGGGIQLLVGGGNKSISLQPALSETRGFGVSAGVGYLYLKPMAGDRDPSYRDEYDR